MLSWILKVLSWITSIWSGIPDSTKDKIIEAIVDSFSAIFRNYYQSTKKSEDNKDD